MSRLSSFVFLSTGFLFREEALLSTLIYMSTEFHGRQDIQGEPYYP